jgi:hypothetical protein
MSKESLQFWTNVVPHYITEPIEVFAQDRLMKNLFKDYIWIICKDKGGHYDQPIIYFTDLLNVYILDGDSIRKYKKFRRKYHRHPFIHL